MAISINDNFRAQAGKHVDDRYLKGVTPYIDVADANATIVISRRHLGLTVRIGADEYWWKDGIENLDLVIKETGGAILNVDGGNATSIYNTIPSIDGGGA